MLFRCSSEYREENITEEELKRIKEILIQIGNLVQKFEKEYYKIQLEIISKIISCINSNLEMEEKTEFILRNYNILYQPKVGLGEFYIHADDFQTRLKLNEPLDKLRDELWSIIKKYK
ncbi:MAG: hypothetical protein NC089_03620 [Bacteroides sp.]|nr:hypothetical protein [Bacteroides sp.]MCM1549744.1 hypothetical protein [Clostridium sp.]